MFHRSSSLNVSALTTYIFDRHFFCFDRERKKHNNSNKDNKRRHDDEKTAIDDNYLLELKPKSAMHTTNS